MSARQRRGLLVGAVACLSGAVLVLGGAATAAMLAVPSTGTPGLLELTWGPTPQQVDGLDPGDVVHWQLGAHLNERSEGEFSLQLRAQGDLAEMSDGLELRIARCAVEYTGFPDAPVCATGELSVLGPAPVSAIADAVSSGTWSLPPLVAGESQFYLATVAIPADITVVTGAPELEGSVGFGFTVVGADAPAPAPGLAATGTDVLAAVLGALGVILLGLALLASRRETDARGATIGRHIAAHHSADRPMPTPHGAAHRSGRRS